jgi:uracil-DNA glycosylase
MDTPQPTRTWSDLLANEKKQTYLQSLLASIKQERAKGEAIYPAHKDLFNAFKHTPLETLKVVIIGQDPYHGPGQAHGLSFSVPHHMPIPPSLRNIYQELNNDLGINPAKHGCLTQWASQGVLLLNSVLSVAAGKAQSHANRGWERFTDHIIAKINTQQRPLVFMLWGAYAQRKGEHIDPRQHLILKSTHPSPLSAHRGFLGCQHFSKANHWLTQQGTPTIEWSLEE